MDGLSADTATINQPVELHELSVPELDEGCFQPFPKFSAFGSADRASPFSRVVKGEGGG